MLAWIGLVLSAVGVMFTGYEFVKKNPEIVEKIVHHEQNFMYTHINVAYDVKTGRHWFQHADGQWRDFPPSPSQVEVQNRR